MQINEVLPLLNKVKKTSAGYMACCPAHDDKTPSLSIKEVDGKVLMKCHAGCDYSDVLDAAGLKQSDFTQKQQKPEIVKTYDYTDATGKLIYQVVRMYPKSFRQRQPKHGSNDWHWHLRGVERLLYRLPEVIAATGRVYICEGEKDADALCKLGAVATCNSAGALSNADGWLDSYTRALKGKDVIVIADKDAPGRKSAAIIRNAIGAPVIELPGKYVKDSHDFISNGGTLEQIEAIADSPPEWDHNTPESEDKRAVTSPDNGKQGGRQRINIAEIADKYADTLRDDKGRLKIRWSNGIWYEFNGAGWNEISSREIEGRIAAYLRLTDEVGGNVSRNLISNVAANLAAKDLCGLMSYVKMPTWLDTGKSANNWIAFKNGKTVNVMDYAAGAEIKDCTRDISPDFFSTDFVSYDWEPDTECPLFHKFLMRILPDVDSRHLVQEMAGLLLADTPKYEVFFQLYGNGANGKSTLIDILRAMVGRQNVSYVELSDITARFQSWPLAFSKVNICGDMPTDLGRGTYAAMEGKFKDLISGGMIEVERKGADKFNAPCRSRFVMASNTLPTFVDKSDGIWRRLRIVDFPVQIPEEERDPDLSRKIIAEELPGIAAWALCGLNSVINCGVSEPEGSKEMKRMHRMSCDHERTFLTENYEQRIGAKISSKSVYEEYKTWIMENGYRPLGAAKFFNRVEQVFPSVLKKKLKIEGIGVQGFENLFRASIID